MRRPRAFQPRKAYTARRQQANSRVGAAVALVRVEYERARLEFEVEGLRRRAAAADRELQLLSRQSAELTACIDAAPSPEPVAAGTPLSKPQTQTQAQTQAQTQTQTRTRTQARRRSAP